MKKYLLLCSSAILSLGLVPQAHANPEGGSVAAGSARITQSAKITDIHQSSGKAIIDWTSFDVAGDEAVAFHQPDSSSIVLNRIHDHKASQIDGSITANGHVMLLNQNGVVLGAGSKVDVGSLTVSSADIDNDDFMAGRYDFNQAGKSDAAIINHGTITAKEAGLVSLVAPEVENNGVIIAKLGKVQMAAADSFSLDLAGDGLIQVAVSNEEAKKLASNTGRITAQGGYVAITAGHARNIIDSVVENSGVIEANSMTNVGGKIILSAGHGITKMSGSMDASGLSGGGSIKIGGDYQGSGKDGTANSARTLVTQEAVINASATQTGNGGEVIVWADEDTYFYGDIEAKGGAVNGDGGFAEVSGKQYLDFNGNVDLSGAELGTLLLDPDDIDIVAGSANPAEFADDSILFAENSGLTSTIGADVISTRLSANANVTLQATNTIDVDAAIASTGSGDLSLETASGGTISVNAAIDVNAGDLTIKADEINISANLNGTGDIQLNTADTAQDIEIGSSDASRLNLEATELAYLQDGWNSILIGGSGHRGTITVNQSVVFTDHTSLRNYTSTSGDYAINLHADVTTTDNSDLYLYGRGNGSSNSSWSGIYTSSAADLNVARDLFMYGNSTNLRITGAIATGRDFLSNGNDDYFYNSVDVGRNFTHSSAWHLHLQSGANISADGDILTTVPRISLHSSTSISGNIDGSSTITFRERGQDDDMEVGGTSRGATWQMSASEFNTIQDGFDSVVFGSDSYTGSIYVTGAIDSGTNGLKLQADEIEISGNLSGTGDIQLTSADGSQEIEIGSTDTSRLNLTAAELAYLQDGWNQITIGDSSGRSAQIFINEDLSFSDNVAFRNPVGVYGNRAIDVNSSITTTDGADLAFYASASQYSQHDYDAVHIMSGLDFDVAGDLIINGGNQDVTLQNSSTYNVGGDFYLTSGNNSYLASSMNIAGDFIADFDGNGTSHKLSISNGATIAVGGDATLSSADLGYLGISSTSSLVAQGNISSDFETYSLAGLLQAQGSGSISLDGKTGGTTTITGSIDSGSGDLTLRADEIDISGNVIGTGDLQLTTLDAAQEIEIGLIDSAALNLTATELGFLQDGWNSITIGATDHNSVIKVNEAVSFSDHTHLKNFSGISAASAVIDVNADITTTDNADLFLHGSSGGAGPHGYDGVNIGANLNIARDLGVYSPTDQVGVYAGVTVGRDMSISANNALVINDDIITGRDFTLNESGTAYAQLRAGKTIDAAGGINISTSTPLVLYANSALESDGDITIKSSSIDIDSTATINGNSDGSSSLVFLESNEDDGMEFGGTSAGFTWNMSQAEIDTIQDGFNTITFGSENHLGAMTITGDVSFSDDVVMRQDQDNATGSLNASNGVRITTTDGADASFYGRNGAWNQIRIDAAGDALFDGFSTLTFNDVNVGGNLTSLGFSNNLHSNASVVVGGDLTFSGPGSLNLGYSAASDMQVNGDISLTSRYIDIYDGSTISGNTDGSSSIVFKEYGEDNSMEIGSNSTAYNWQLTSTELAALQDGFSDISFGSTEMTGNMYFSGDISFSDNVRFIQSQTSGSAGMEGYSGMSFSTTDGANISFYHGQRSVNWTNVFFNIAGDALFSNMYGLTIGNSSFAGDWDIQARGGIGIHSGQSVTVGGNMSAEAAGEIFIGHSNGAHLQVDGDTDITSKRIRLYQTSSISGNADGSSSLVFKEHGEDEGMEIGSSTTGYAWQMDANEVAVINSNFESVVFGSSSMSGDVTINGWDLNGKAYDVNVMANDINVSGIALGAGDVTLTSINDINLNAAVGNNAQGGDVHFVVGNDFINNVGSSGINTGNGRYLIYAASPLNVTKNGLSASNLYERTYALNPPSGLSGSGSYFVFASVDPNPPSASNSSAVPDDFTPSVEYLAAANNFDNLLPSLPVVPNMNVSNTVLSVNNAPVKLKKRAALGHITNSDEIHADVRLVEAQLLEVEKPVIYEYDLCSHSGLYCR
ncbi:MAG: two-partner secretion domain-containing protein [Alcanivorax sp.]